MFDMAISLYFACIEKQLNVSIFSDTKRIIYRSYTKLPLFQISLSICNLQAPVRVPKFLTWRLVYTLRVFKSN